MMSVNTAEKMPRAALPNTFSACTPAPAAPSVCANVLSVRMAASGRSMSALSARRRAPAVLPSASSAATKLGVMLSSTASMIEHRKETPTARRT